MMDQHKSKQELIEELAETRRQAEHWRSIVTNTPVFVCLVDRAGTIQYLNHTVPGIAMEDAIGRSTYEFLKPDYWEIARQCIERVFDTGQTAFYEAVSAGPNGSSAWYETSVGPVNVGDQVVAVTLIATDITLRKQAEEERDRDRAILAAAIDCLPFEFFAIGTDGRYMLQNAVGRQHCGDSIGKRPEDSAPDEYTRQLWLENNRRAFAGERVEGEVQAHVKGEIRTYYNIISPIQGDGTVCGILGVNVDLTERKRAEEALRLSEEHHRVLTETMLQGVVHHDAEGTIIAMNPAAEHILGKTREQFLGSSSTGEEHGTIREDGSLFPGVEHPAMVALRTGQPVTGVVMGVFNQKVDAFRWISIDAVPLFRPGENRPYQVYAVFEDITDRKQAEEALKKAHDELEEKVQERTAELAIFKKFADASGLGLTMTGLDGHIAYANSAWLRLVGESQVEDVIGQHISTYCPKEYLERRDTEVIPAILQNGLWQGEFALVSRDGRIIPAIHSIFPIRDKGGNFVQLGAVVTDIT
jgi:PAS domain S-box-containing protein